MDLRAEYSRVAIGPQPRGEHGSGKKRLENVTRLQDNPALRGWVVTSWAFKHDGCSGGTAKDTRFALMGPRDAETGNDPTLFRMYNPRVYRWLSPDPLAGDITNPQTLNRYSYVTGNPVNFVDPLGLYLAPIECGIGSDVWGAECPGSPPGPWNDPGPVWFPGGGGGGGGVGNAQDQGRAGAGTNALGTDGCIEPSLLTWFGLQVLRGGAIAASALTGGRIKSVGLGVGGSANRQLPEVPLQAVVGSVSFLDVVDKEGNAAQTLTIGGTGGVLGVGTGAIGGVQAQVSMQPVPKTPQSTAVNGIGDMGLISVGAATPEGGAAIDITGSGTATVTVGPGVGGKAVATGILLATQSTPYCR